MENNVNNIDNILKKLRKLQASYEGAKAINSENEAATAAAMINKLLLQYNLTMSQVESYSNGCENPITEMFESGYTKKSIGGKWEYRLYYVLCKFNLCRCYMWGNSYKNLYLVGEKENLEMVKWMKEMLADKYVAISKIEYKKYVEHKKSIGLKPKGIEVFQRSYLMGCVAGLEDKLRIERKNMEDAQQVEALVLVKDQAIKQFIDSRYRINTVKSTSTLRGAVSAYTLGYSEGRRTTLAKPVASATVKMKALNK